MQIYWNCHPESLFVFVCGGGSGRIAHTCAALGSTELTHAAACVLATTAAINDYATRTSVILSGAKDLLKLFTEKYMATWSSRGLRGSQLEELINITNEKYRESALALIQKIPTPIKPVEIDDNRHITLAYFEQRSTVDYIGVVQSYPVCFDAKECATESFALANVHEHQYQFMKDFEAQGGIAFLLIYFTGIEQFYYMRFKELDKFYQRAAAGGPKNFKTEELDPDYMLHGIVGAPVHYLEGINRDIDEDDRDI